MQRRYISASRQIASSKLNLPGQIMPLMWFIATAGLLANCGAVQWRNEPVFINSSSANENLMSLQAEINYEGRNPPTFSAIADFKYQIDDTTMIEVNITKASTDQSKDSRTELLYLPKKPFKEYLDQYYKDGVYSNLGYCSNFPLPGTEWPWPKFTLKMDKCSITGDRLPEVLPGGYYMIDFQVTGEVEWRIVCVLKIISKLNIIGL